MFAEETAELSEEVRWVVLHVHANHPLKMGHAETREPVEDTIVPAPDDGTSSPGPSEDDFKPDSRATAR